MRLGTDFSKGVTLDGVTIYCVGNKRRITFGVKIKGQSRYFTLRMPSDKLPQNKYKEHTYFIYLNNN
jgi:hypothetical protein